MKNTPPLKKGDCVAYRAAFLRAINDYSYDSAHRRGVVLDVTSVSGYPILHVRWTGYKGIFRVSPDALLRADCIPLEAV